MSEKLHQNLNFLMAETRLNAEELSRRINLPASTIKKIRNNEDANPTLSTLTPIAKYFCLTISQLIGDEPLSPNRIKGSYQINPSSLTQIPIISWHEAITWPNSTNSFTTATTEHIYSKNAYGLLVEEENWENLTKNTVLLIDPELNAEHRDFIIIHKNGQLPTIKQALFDDGQIYLKPIITGYNITTLTPEHKILGVVVEYKKHLKKPYSNNNK